MQVEAPPVVSVRPLREAAGGHPLAPRIIPVRIFYAYEQRWSSGEADMAGRRASEPEQEGEVGAVKGRLNELCEYDWDGKVTRMAKDLEMPQPALWKILRGDQPPNAQLLVAL